MKKIFAILLAVTIFASMATIVSAAENSKTTTLTTTVPAASYTLNIPANQTIPFGEEYTNIGRIRVTNSAGFAEGKNLKVTITYTDFTCENTETSIPIKLNISNMTTPSQLWDDEEIASGAVIRFKGQADGTVSEHAAGNRGVTRPNAWLIVDSDDWGKALAGEYTATITFTAEVVAS